jgi:hypothetical protein
VAASRGIGLERRAVAAAQQAQGERRGRHAIAQVIGIMAAGARQHRFEGDARLREGSSPRRSAPSYGAWIARSTAGRERKLWSSRGARLATALAAR